MAAADGKELTRSQLNDYTRLEERFNELSDLVGEDGLDTDADDPRQRHSRNREELEQPRRNSIINPGNEGRANELDESALLGPEQRFADLVQSSEEPLRFGRLLRGLATGDWRDAQAERRALGEGTLGAGGALVPEDVAAQVIDLARAKAVAIRAGARTARLETDKTHIARQISDPTAEWKEENVAATESGITFDRVSLDAETLVIGPVRASRELIEDAVNFDEVITRSFSNQVALKLDHAILSGSGVSPEPLGLRNTPGVQTVAQGANGAALADYAPFLEAILKVRQANAEPNAVIWTPRSAAHAGGLTDADGNPLKVPDDFANLSKYTTTWLPDNLTVGTSNDTSEAFVGQWSDIIVGIRTELTIAVLTERYAEFGQVGFLGWMRADVAVVHPESFAIIEGIRPAA